jgi:thiol-disulfide isomerase/thioredoxin
VIVLNFWATWCGPCQVEIPWFVEFQQRLSQVAILGVAMDEDGWKSVQPFLDKRAVNYPVVLGNDNLANA